MRCLARVYFTYFLYFLFACNAATKILKGATRAGYKEGAERASKGEYQREREGERDLFVDFPLISLVGFFGALFFYLAKVLAYYSVYSIFVASSGLSSFFFCSSSYSSCSFPYSVFFLSLGWGKDLILLPWRVVLLTYYADMIKCCLPAASALLFLILPPLPPAPAPSPPPPPPLSGCANLRRLNPCGLWATWGFVWGLSRLSIKSEIVVGFPSPSDVTHVYRYRYVACLLNSILILLNLICSNHAHLGGRELKVFPRCGKHLKISPSTGTIDWN